MLAWGFILWLLLDGYGEKVCDRDAVWMGEDWLTGVGVECWQFLLMQGAKSVMRYQSEGSGTLLMKEYESD